MRPQRASSTGSNAGRTGQQPTTMNVVSSSHHRTIMHTAISDSTQHQHQTRAGGGGQGPGGAGSRVGGLGALRGGGRINARCNALCALFALVLLLVLVLRATTSLQQLHGHRPPAAAVPVLARGGGGSAMTPIAARSRHRHNATTTTNELVTPPTAQLPVREEDFTAFGPGQGRDVTTMVAALIDLGDDAFARFARRVRRFSGTSNNTITVATAPNATQSTTVSDCEIRRRWAHVVSHYTRNVTRTIQGARSGGRVLPSPQRGGSGRTISSIGWPTAGSVEFGARQEPTGEYATVIQRQRRRRHPQQDHVADGGGDGTEKSEFMDIVYTWANESDPTLLYKRYFSRKKFVEIAKGKQGTKHHANMNHKTLMRYVSLMHGVNLRCSANCRSLEFSVRSFQQHTSGWHRGRVVVVTPGGHLPSFISHAENFFRNSRAPKRRTKTNTTFGRRLVFVHRDALVPLPQRFSLRNMNTLEHHLHKLAQLTPLFLQLRGGAHFATRRTMLSHLVNPLGGPIHFYEKNTDIESAGNKTRGSVEFNAAVHGTQQLVALHIENSSSLPSSLSVEPVLPVAHAPLVMCKAMLTNYLFKRTSRSGKGKRAASFSSLVASASSEGLLSNEKSYSPTDIIPAQLEHALVHDRPWAASPKFFGPESDTDDANDDFDGGTNSSSKSVVVAARDRTIFLDNEDGCAPAVRKIGGGATGAGRVAVISMLDPSANSIFEVDTITFQRRVVGRSALTALREAVEDHSTSFAALDHSSYSVEMPRPLLSWLSRHYPGRTLQSTPTSVAAANSSVSNRLDNATSNTSQTETEQVIEGKDSAPEGPSAELLLFREYMRYPLVVVVKVEVASDDSHASTGSAGCSALRSLEFALPMYEGKVHLVRVVSLSPRSDVSDVVGDVDEKEDALFQRAVNSSLLSRWVCAACLPPNPKRVSLHTLLLRHRSQERHAHRQAHHRNQEQQQDNADDDEEGNDEVSSLVDSVLKEAAERQKVFVIDLRGGTPIRRATHGHDDHDVVDGMLMGGGSSTAVVGQTLALEDFRAVGARRLELSAAKDAARINWVKGPDEASVLRTFPLPSAKYEDVSSGDAGETRLKFLGP